MTTTQHLAALCTDAHCPGCQGPLRAEEDDRWPSGFSWYCPAPDCTEDGGCWPVPAALARRAESAAAPVPLCA